MDRRFKREYTEEDLERVAELNKIGVFSFAHSSGTTFIATSLAKYLADHKKKAVAFIELKQDNLDCQLLYEAIGMDKRFLSREFISFFARLQAGLNIKSVKNMDAGINWAVRTPNDRANDRILTPLQEARLIHNICADWIVCDLGCHFHKESFEEMDMLICVIDPMPAKLLSSKTRLQQLSGAGIDNKHLVFLLNKNNQGINNKLLKAFLKLSNPIKVPLIPEEWFYVAQYHCKLPFEQDEIKKQALPIIEELVNHHILFT